jgi:hypothetical protein
MRTTQIAAGTAIAMSVKMGAVMGPGVSTAVSGAIRDLTRPASAAVIP